MEIAMNCEIQRESAQYEAHYNDAFVNVNKNLDRMAMVWNLKSALSQYDLTLSSMCSLLSNIKHFENLLGDRL